jgi:hypothetical protein
MKKFIFGLNLILILCFLCLAQKQKTDPNEPVTPQKQSAKQNTRGKNTRSDNNLLLNAGTNIETQLEQTLDVKKSRVGDEVVLTTTKTIKQNGEIVVQKGSRLIGRITEVQQKTKDNATSKLAVVFERLEGKNLNTPISATIVSITGARAGATVADTLESDISAGSSSSGTASKQSSSGGGLLGGVTGTVGGVVNATTNTVGSVTNTAGQTLGGTTQSLGRNLGGIQISQSASASAQGSTTLSAANKNLRVDKGATVLLRLNQSVEN